MHLVDLSKTRVIVDLQMSQMESGGMETEADGRTEACGKLQSTHLVSNGQTEMEMVKI